MLTRLFAGLLLWGVTATPSRAQTSRPADSVARADNAAVDVRSPRRAMSDYLHATRRGDYATVVAYFPGESTERGIELARRLKAVLDRHLWIDVDVLSASALGDTTDGLPRDRERLGEVPGPDGDAEFVTLRRSPSDGGPPWVFTASTIERIDAWYSGLDDHWMRERMPLALQQPGPFGIERWQFGLLLLLLPIALVLAWVATAVTASLAHRLSARTETTLDDRLLEGTRGPVRALWTILLFRGLVEFAGLPIGMEQAVGLAARTSGVLAFTWLLMRVTYVLERELPEAPWATGRPEVRSVLPLLGRVARVFLLALGAIAVVAQFGYSVATLVAGLGIGGIAVALAAQKTLEHVFGSVAIGLDQPIRIGDFIKVGGIEGTVEAIGLRSTRIRTVERSVVAFPNGKLSEQMMENLGVRDRIVLRTTIGLEYGTTVAQLRAVRDDVEALLRADPLVWPDVVSVRFTEFGESSLEIKIVAWIVTTDVLVYREHKEQLLYGMMDIVARHGCAFAFPTRTVHIVGPTP